jgi:hypothetical protein
MGKRKAETTETTKERAAVGRERRLALALVGLMDACATVEPGNKDAAIGIEEAEMTATTLLNDLGYSNLESTAKTLARINDHIKDAVAAGDGERLAELGKELRKAQVGKFRRTATLPVNNVDGK